MQSFLDFKRSPSYGHTYRTKITLKKQHLVKLNEYCRHPLAGLFLILLKIFTAMKSRQSSHTKIVCENSEVRTTLLAGRGVHVYLLSRIVVKKSWEKHCTIDAHPI